MAFDMSAKALFVYLFVCLLLNLLAARIVMSERKESGPVRPCHIREAYRRLKLEGKVPKRSVPRLFRQITSYKVMRFLLECHGEFGGGQIVVMIICFKNLLNYKTIVSSPPIVKSLSRQKIDQQQFYTLTELSKRFCHKMLGGPLRYCEKKKNCTKAYRFYSSINFNISSQDISCKRFNLYDIGKVYLSCDDYNDEIRLFC